jgi:Ser/Thr protein kinase RdoA (MazF antagonist)
MPDEVTATNIVQCETDAVASSPHKRFTRPTIAEFATLFEAWPLPDEVWYSDESLRDGATATAATLLAPPSLVVENVHEIPGGFNNTTFRIDLSRPAAEASPPLHVRVALRLSRRQSWPRTKLDGEVAALRFMRDRTDVPVPRVYFYAAMPHAPLELDAMCMEWLDGETLTAAKFDAMDSAAQDRCITETVRALAAIQQVRLPTVGRVVAYDATTPGPQSLSIGPFFDFGGCQSYPRSGPFHDMAEYLEEQLTMRRSQIERASVTLARPPHDTVCASTIDQWRGLVERLATILEGQRAVIAAVPIVLSHTDFCGRNMLFDLDSGRLNGVVDWEWACATHASHDWWQGFDDVGERCRKRVAALAQMQGHHPTMADVGLGVVERTSGDAQLTMQPHALCPITWTGIRESAWMAGAIDTLFPWTLSAHFNDPAQFPCDDPMAVIAGACNAVKWMLDSRPV